MPEDWSIAGDMLASSEIMGLGAGFHLKGHNCVHCEVHSDDLDKLEPARLRTRRSLWWNAHLPDPQQQPQDQYPFQCPSCGALFSSQEDVDQEPSPSDMNYYRKIHFSTAHHRPPLLDIEPSRVYTCSLHLLLSITKKLFHCAIRLNIDTQAMANAVNGLLEKHDIQFTPLTPITSRTKKVGRPLAFTGAECIRVLKATDEFLEVVFASSESKKKKHRIIFEDFVSVFDAIRKRFSSSEGREGQAMEISRLARKFRDSFLKCFHESEVNYYIHELVHHVPQQVLQCPVRFFSCSGHGIEILNHKFKRLTR